MREVILIGVAKVNFLVYHLFLGYAFQTREILTYYNPSICAEISTKTID